MWRKVFRPRGVSNKWEEQSQRGSPIPKYMDDDEDSTVGSVDSIIGLPPIPPDMTEPTKAGAAAAPQSSAGPKPATAPGGARLMKALSAKTAGEGSKDQRRRSLVDYRGRLEPPRQTPQSCRCVRPGTIKAFEQRNTMQLSDFHLIKTIGTGSFGRVFLARPSLGPEHKAAALGDVDSARKHSPTAAAAAAAAQVTFSDDAQVLATAGGAAAVIPSGGANPPLTKTGSSSSAKPVWPLNMPNYVAIKRLSKCTVLDMKQVHHVQSEKEILEMIDHPFMVKMLGTFQDSFYLYIVMEFVEGGEFFSFLRKSKRLSDEHSKFYAAHVVLIFEYLHDRCVVYRDLKPENLLITKLGYLKLTDFGFAKYLMNRTYTLCGTPEYIAPEVLLNKGHGFPVDWWALGVLIYEMIVGYPPFFDEDALCIYQKILRGKIIFPRLFPKDAKSLVKHLLCHDLVRRIGHVRDGESDVRHHRWFKDLIFADLVKQLVVPPHVPRESDNAFKYFGEYAEDVSQAPAPAYDPFADW